MLLYHYVLKIMKKKGNPKNILMIFSICQLFVYF